MARLAAAQPALSLPHEAVAQTPGEAAGPFLSAGPEIAHLVRRKRLVHRWDVPHVGSGAHFRECAARFSDSFMRQPRTHAGVSAWCRRRRRVADRVCDRDRRGGVPTCLGPRLVLAYGGKGPGIYAGEPRGARPDAALDCAHVRNGHSRTYSASRLTAETPRLARLRDMRTTATVAKHARAGTCPQGVLAATAAAAKACP